MTSKARAAVFSNLWQTHGCLLHDYGLTAVFTGKAHALYPHPSAIRGKSVQSKCEVFCVTGCRVFLQGSYFYHKEAGSLSSRIVPQRLSTMQDTCMDEGQGSCSTAGTGWCEESSLQ